MTLNNLAPPGSSSYTSKTMHVGDGTWDKTRDDFLLPNLQGLNFATMRYNGMGNRFKGQPEYHTLVLGHGVLAAITFIAIMPAAIFLAKYGHDWPGPRVSFKLHIYLQIITVFLSTVVLVLGWFAVGPKRSLTNPHHGIGVAIYALILFQFLYGWCWFRRERARKTAPNKLPLTVWLHRLLGRSTALLAFIQIGLGLTLYGSPKYLFILYSLTGAFFLFMYLFLDYYYMPRSDGRPSGRPQSEFYSDYGSAISGSAVRPQRRQEGHWGRDLLAAGGLIGAYEWFKDRRDRRREERDEKYAAGRNDIYDGQPGGRPPPGPVTSDGGYLGPPPPGPPLIAGAARTRRPMSEGGASRESWEEDKFTDRHERPRWGTRVMEATGAFAAYEGVRSLFNRRRRRDDEYSDEGSYGSALGGNRPIPSQTDVSRVEAGQAPMSPDTPRVNMGGAQAMTPTMTPSRPPRGAAAVGESMSDDSRDHYDPRRPRPLLNADAPLSEHVRELGPIAGVREWNRQRKARRESDRADNARREEMENEESFNRRSSNHYPRPQDASNRRHSMSGTQLTGPSGPGNSEMSRANLGPDTSHPPLPAEAGTLSSRHPGQGYTLPPPPPGPPPTGNWRSDGYDPQPQAGYGSAQMPEGTVNPDPARLLRDNTAANESSAYGRDPRARDEVAGVAAAGAVGGLAADAARNRNRGQSHSSSRAQDSRNRLPRSSRRGSIASGSGSNNGLASQQRSDNPEVSPVQLQVKMNPDGITLRRLNNEEAAAGREARRQERSRRRRGSSLSSDGEGGRASSSQRFRRNGAGAGGVRASSEQPIRNVPPPPPMSSSAGASFRRDSELNLPPANVPPPPQQHQPQQQYTSSASNQGFSSPPNASGMGLGYGTDGGTGTDVSAFADNRRRRRMERARRAEASRGAEST